MRQPKATFCSQATTRKKLRDEEDLGQAGRFPGCQKAAPFQNSGKSNIVGTWGIGLENVSTLPDHLMINDPWSGKGSETNRSTGES